MEIDELLDAAAQAAVEHRAGDVPAHFKPGSDVRCFVWDRHFATPEQNRRLDEKLAESTAEFRDQVAAVERHLADELAADTVRLAKVRVEHPELYKDYN